MRILFLHNKYKIGGGEDVSTQSEIDLLRAYGHEVDCIFADNKDIDSKSKIRVAVETIWSNYYFDLVSEKLQQKKYDIVHVQNFFPQISPSVFAAAKKHGVKTVMSIRNYRLICPNALLYVNNQICKKCVTKSIPYPALFDRCYRDNLSATAVSAAMLGYHKIFGTWLKNVDGFIAISSFVKEQMIEGGLPADRIHVKYNFVNTPPVFEGSRKNHFVYVGRLSTEKGIELMLEAFTDDGMRDNNLRIIGDGPQKDLVLRYAAKFRNVEYVGKLPILEAYKQISEASALVFPSKWHEPFGRTIVESFSMGTPVIGSAVGGVTELVCEGVNGFLFPPTKDGLIDAVSRFKNVTDSEAISISARKSYLENFTGEINYQVFMDIYESILKQSSSKAN